MNRLAGNPRSSEGPFLRLRDPGPDPRKDEWTLFASALEREDGALTSAQQRYSSPVEPDQTDDLRIVTHETEGNVSRWIALVCAGGCLIVGFLGGAILL